jgi:hypothetical protein
VSGGAPGTVTSTVASAAVEGPHGTTPQSGVAGAAAATAPHADQSSQLHRTGAHGSYQRVHARSQSASDAADLAVLAVKEAAQMRRLDSEFSTRRHQLCGKDLALCCAASRGCLILSLVLCDPLLMQWFSVPDTSCVRNRMTVHQQQRNLHSLSPSSPAETTMETTMELHAVAAAPDEEPRDTAVHQQSAYHYAVSDGLLQATQGCCAALDRLQHQLLSTEHANGGDGRSPVRFD